MVNNDLDNDLASKYSKRIHRHGRIKCLARSVWCTRNIDNKQTSVRLGTLCPICGFNPNETAKKWIRETKMEARRSRAWRVPVG